jgi:hypothetical protein
MLRRFAGLREGPRRRTVHHIGRVVLQVPGLSPGYRGTENPEGAGMSEGTGVPGSI